MAVDAGLIKEKVKVDAQSDIAIKSIAIEVIKFNTETEGNHSHALDFTKDNK